MLTPAAGEPVRNRILRAAKCLFAQRGYEHASTASIAREAGTSESQLVKHFGSKAGLLEAIFTDSWHALIAETRAALDATTSAAEKLPKVTQIVIAHLNRDLDLKRLMLLESRRVRKAGQPVALSDGFLAFIRLIDEVLAEIESAGLLRDGVRPHAARSALFGLLEGMFRDRYLAEHSGFPADFDHDQLGKVLGIFLAAITAAPA